MDKSAKIFVAGHRGMVGAALMRKLAESGYTGAFGLTRHELDLRRQADVERFFRETRVDHVFLAAATVGGILANAERPVEFLYDNLMIATNVIRAAGETGVQKLLFLGSSCIYPKLASQPIRESSLLTGALEPTNEAYAIAKIAGLKLCSYYRKQYGRNFISAMPTNLYGPCDNFHPTGSHVVPGLMRRFHEAKASGAPSVALWGTGKPRRELLHVDDLAQALLLLMDRYDGEETINVGSGEELTIADLGRAIAKAVGYPGRLTFDTTKPDGTPRKLLDSRRIKELGWRPTIKLEAGLAHAYEWALTAGVLDLPKAV